MASELKYYEVQARLKNPGGNGGYDIYVTATSKKDAVKQARKRITDCGHTRQDGPISYTAVEVQS